MTTKSEEVEQTSDSLEKKPANKQESSKKNRIRRWRFIAVFLGVLTFVLMLVVWLLPTIIASTGLKNSILSTALTKAEVEASIDRADLSWFGDQSVSDISIASKKNQSRATLDNVATSSGLFDWMFKQSTEKSLEIEGVQLVVDIDRPNDGETDTEDATSGTAAIPKRTILFSVEDVDVSITSEHVDKPYPLLENISLQGTLVRGDDDTQVKISPIDAVSEKEVSAELCASALKYVAPILAETTWAEGSISVSLDEWQLTLGDPYQIRGTGKLTIHSLDAGLKSPLAIEISQLISKLIKKPLPTKVKLAEESTVYFAMENGVISHEGLAFGLPEISDELQIRTSGSVGLDESLDLLLEIPLPLHLLGDGPFANALGSQTLYLPVKGTIDEPKIEFEGDGQLVSELLSNLAEKATDGDLDLQQLIEQIRKRREERDPNEPTLLDRWRERRQQRGPLFRRRR